MGRETGGLGWRAWLAPLTGLLGRAAVQWAAVPENPSRAWPMGRLWFPLPRLLCLLGPHRDQTMETSASSHQQGRSQCPSREVGLSLCGLHLFPWPGLWSPRQPFPRPLPGHPILPGSPLCSCAPEVLPLGGRLATGQLPCVVPCRVTPHPQPAPGGACLCLATAGWPLCCQAGLLLRPPGGKPSAHCCCWLITGALGTC